MIYFIKFVCFISCVMNICKMHIYNMNFKKHVKQTVKGLQEQHQM